MMSAGGGGGKNYGGGGSAGGYNGGNMGGSGGFGGNGMPGGSSGYGGGGNSIAAAVNTKHTFKTVMAPSSNNGGQSIPTVEINSNSLPLTLRFNSKSSSINSVQRHMTGKGRTAKSNVVDEPDILYQTVKKPIIQEIREIIQPYRKRTQEIRPVEEQIQTVIARGTSDGGGKGESGGAGDQGIGMVVGGGALMMLGGKQKDSMGGGYSAKSGGSMMGSGGGNDGGFGGNDKYGSGGSGGGYSSKGGSDMMQDDAHHPPMDKVKDAKKKPSKYVL